MLFTARFVPEKKYSESRDKIKKAFQRNSSLANEDDIKKAIARGEFVLKELEALIFLKKYRTMKNRYYKDE